jgi:peptidoglycan/xylan/chitin deacetylase (PgdA/CDA1 family)
MLLGKVFVSALALGAAVGNPVPGYKIPTSWPANDQTVMITGSFLEDPLIVDAMNQVKAAVPAAILSIPPSTYISGNTVTYNADPVANCYWPNGLCLRSADTAVYKADVSKCPGDNTWGLTYDDGPSVNLVNGTHVSDSAALRETLADAGLKATFFVTGTNTNRNPDEVLKAAQEGHQIAVHTWTHHPLTSLTNEQIVAEMKFTEAAIYKATGLIPTYIRPPYGDVDDRVRAIVTALGYRSIMWTSVPDRDSHDTGAIDAAGKAAVVAAVKGWSITQPGFISLEHDHSTIVSDIAISIVKDLKAAGASNPLKVMPVGTCLGDKNWYSNQDGNQDGNKDDHNGGNSGAANLDSSITPIIMLVVFTVAYNVL